MYKYISVLKIKYSKDRIIIKLFHRIYKQQNNINLLYYRLIEFYLKFMKVYLMIFVKGLEN